MPYFILFLFIGVFLDEQVIEVKVTTYHIQGRTASGLRTTKIKEPFVALSRDLLRESPIGSYIYLSGCKWEGMYKVMDKMGRSKIASVDVYSPLKKTGEVKCQCAAVK